MTGVRTTCPYCGVGCGIIAKPGMERAATIEGDPCHPANCGKLCSKGTHLGETIGLEGRLLHPMVDGERVSWDAALDQVAGAFRAAIRDHGPDSIAFYVSGQLLTEDYYVANKLMKGFIGSANIDTNSRLCMSSAVVAHQRAFGEDVVPCDYADLDAADLIILLGSNTAWCHPVIWQRIEAARITRGTRLVVIDPRRTETADRADLHLPLRLDGDVSLFEGLLRHLRAKGALDEAYLADHVDVPEHFWAEPDCAVDLATATGLDPDLIARFFALVEAYPRMVTLFSQGANQSIAGSDKGNAIINLHLATGRIGNPGMGPFSITGQPNAMGGREVGGLASMLAAHMDFSAENCERVQRFWKSPVMATRPGLKAVDLFRAVHSGRIKALWIMGTNPAMSMPDAGFVREALARCPLVIVSDVMADTDTGRLAHIQLPALAWGEKDGTVTNSERMISRQRPFLAPPGEARPDWAIVAQVGQRMGYPEAFGFDGPHAVFAEYAAQTCFENGGARKLDLTDWLGLDVAAYEALLPRRWGGSSPFADGRFSTPNGRARLVVTALCALPAENSAFPFRLNTGRYRDQWHSMTRTGLSPTLSQHRREPRVEIHPADAERLGLVDGALATVRSAQGGSVYRLEVTDSQRPGELFVPMHWSDVMSSGGRTGRLPDQGADPFSGQPAFKNSAVTIEAYLSDWRGFLVTREPLRLSADHYWTQSRLVGGWLIELAGKGSIEVDALLPAGDRIEAFDDARGTRRIAVRSQDGRLIAALFLTRCGRLPARDWISAQLGEGQDEGAGALLAGRSATPSAPTGPIVCVCFNVGANAILAAIEQQSLASVEAVGVALNAGTNCGSCRPAIAGLLQSSVTQQMEDLPCQSN